MLRKSSVKIMLLLSLLLVLFFMGAICFFAIRNTNWNNIKVPKNFVVLINNMPKTALHVHIEGTLEPELAWKFAVQKGYGKNKPLKISKPNGSYYDITSLSELKKVYKFDNLASFLAVYNKLAGLLETKEDFEKLAEAYGNALLANHVKHAEIFFDPQTHMSRGISFKTIVDGLQIGLDHAREQGVNVQLIVSILRDHPVGKSTDSGDINATNLHKPTGWNVANCVANYNKFCKKDWKIVGIGIDNNEVGYPPKLFKQIYAYLRKNGLFCVAHAGEEGPPDYIWQAIKELHVVRIDHGVRAIEDPNLVRYLTHPHKNRDIIKAFGNNHKIPLTVCPLSNYKLKVFPDPTYTNIIDLLNRGVMVTVNSDDPSYFGGYSTANYIFLIKALNCKVAHSSPITLNDIYLLAKNGFEASVIPKDIKTKYINELDNYFRKNQEDFKKLDKFLSCN